MNFGRQQTAHSLSQEKQARKLKQPAEIYSKSSVLSYEKLCFNAKTVSHEDKRAKQTSFFDQKGSTFDNSDHRFENGVPSIGVFEGCIGEHATVPTNVLDSAIFKILQPIT